MLKKKQEKMLSNYDTEFISNSYTIFNLNI